MAAIQLPCKPLDNGNMRMEPHPRNAGGVYTARGGRRAVRY